MPRLFVALRPPLAAAVRLAALRGEVRGARWLPAESLHLTVLYLGSVQDAEPVVRRLAAVIAPTHRVSLEVKRALPSPRNARVLVYAGEPVAALASLRHRVEAALAGHFEPEDRPFRPHVTLARLKNADQAGVRRWLREPAGSVTFEAHEFVLFESRPGSDYQAIAEYPLTGG